MGTDWTTFADYSNVYASEAAKTRFFKTDIEASSNDATQKMRNNFDVQDNLADNLNLMEDWHGDQDSIKNRVGIGYDAFLVSDGRDIVGSASSSASDVASDVATRMTAESQTVKRNVIGNSITYSRDGDGTVSSFTQHTELSRNDVLLLKCTTAQTVSVDAVFQVNSQVKGTASTTLTADGATAYTNNAFGISSLTVGGGTVSNYWVVGDLITITTTSDDSGYLVSMYRDFYDVALPSTAGSETITNQLTGSGSAFPGSPDDGDRFVLDGVMYAYDSSTTSWVESCV